MTPVILHSPKAIAEAGSRIYAERYRQAFEAAHRGQFVAINVLDASATLGKSASEALRNARAKLPSGIFHLIRVGHEAAFEVGLAQRYAHPSWLDRR